MEYNHFRRMVTYGLLGASFYVSMAYSALVSDSPALPNKSGELIPAKEAAVTPGSDDGVKTFLTKDADIMKTMSDGQNILHWALSLVNKVPRGGDLKATQEVLRTVMKTIEERKLTAEQKKELIGHQDKDGKTPLHYFRGTEEDLEKLLDYKPDLSLQATDGHTVFHQLAKTPACVVNKKFIEYVQATLDTSRLFTLINSMSKAYDAEGETVFFTFIDSGSCTPEQLSAFLETYRPLLHQLSSNKKYTPLCALVDHSAYINTMNDLFQRIGAYAEKHTIHLSPVLNIPCGVGEHQGTLLELFRRKYDTTQEPYKEIDTQLVHRGASTTAISLVSERILCGDLKKTVKGKDTSHRNTHVDVQENDRSKSQGATRAVGTSLQGTGNTLSSQHERGNRGGTQNEESFLKKYGTQLGFGVGMTVGLVAFIAYIVKHVKRQRSAEAADNEGTTGRPIIS